MQDRFIALGAVLLPIGAVASLYAESRGLEYFSVGYTIEHPYLFLGIALFLCGIICIALGVVYLPRKEKTTQPNT